MSVYLYVAFLIHRMPKMTPDNIENIISQLTLTEKVSLLSGAGACSTVSLPRLDIPRLHVSIKAVSHSISSSLNICSRCLMGLMDCAVVGAGSLTL